MGAFKAFVEHAEAASGLLAEFNGVPSAQAAPLGGAAAQPFSQQQKPWSAKKPEILQMWKNLRQDTPIIMTPVLDVPAGNGEHSTYGEDGIRITGSWYFISSVLARLKEITAYENPGSKLRLILRGINKARDARPDRRSFAFYCNLETRAHGKPGRPRTAAPGPAQPGPQT